MLALLLAACQPAAPKFKSTDITGADYGKTLQLTGHDGKPRTLADFSGKAVVITFGFTHCPDVCPTILADLVSERQPRPLTPEIILEATSKMFGFTVEEIVGKSRRRPLVNARQIGMYVFREVTDLSYPNIAKEFGGRDHTTVIHAVEKIGNLMKERRLIFDQVTELVQTVKSAG